MAYLSCYRDGQGEHLLCGQQRCQQGGEVCHGGQQGPSGEALHVGQGWTQAVHGPVSHKQLQNERQVHAAAPGEGHQGGPDDVPQLRLCEVPC